MGASTKLVSSATVSVNGERRVVLGFEIQMHQHPEVCFAWTEPSANNHACIVLRTEEFQAPEDAVRVLIGHQPTGWR